MHVCLYLEYEETVSILIPRKRIETELGLEGWIREDIYSAAFENSVYKCSIFHIIREKMDSIIKRVAK